MSGGPTKGATDRGWQPRPWQAFALRAGVFIAPIVVSFVCVRLVAPWLWRPDGWAGAAVYIIQIAVLGATTATIAARIARRFLPLAALLNMTLVFPDHAPSRFGVALRSGSLAKLRKAAEHHETLLPQEAAETIVSLVTQLGRHERLTRGHTERVRAYADLIAQEMDLSKADRELLAWGAMIHDIGKLEVPADILNLDGRPDDEQWALLRNHPAAGAAIVEPLADWLAPWHLAAGEHHERWDGGGYPHGLAGEKISLAGRIVAVADAYDVITSTRSYKKAMEGEAAREELVRCSGTQFDPQVVRAMLEASLHAPTNRLGAFAWSVEAVQSLIPRGLSQAVTSTGTMATVTAVTVTVGVAAAVPIVVDDGPSYQTAAPAVAEHPEYLAFDPPGTTRTTDALPTTVAAGAETLTTATTEPTTTSDTSDTSDTTAPSSTAGTITTVTAAPRTSAPPATTATTTAAPTTTTTTAPPSTTTTTAPPTTTTTAAPTTTTTAPPSTTTTAPPIGTVYFLKNPGSGNSSAQTFKTLETSGVDDATQPNFDTDRDSVPGLRLEPTGAGWSENDLPQIQRYGMNPSQDLDGPARVTLYVATDGSTSNPVTLRVALSNCNSLYQSCSNAAETSVTIANPVGDGFQQYVIDLGSVNESFGAFRRMVVRLIAEGDQPLHVAFDSSPYPSVLEVNWN